MNVVKEIQRINTTELSRGFKESASWHAQYKDSAYVFVGGVPFDLTEGDLICVFSQYGEIVDVNLVRDKATGKSKGYGFIAYEDQRSTVLAVDNFNGIKILGRTIRVDHVAKYRGPKKNEGEDTEEAEEEERQRKLQILPPHLRPPGLAGEDESDSSGSEGDDDDFNNGGNDRYSKKRRKLEAQIEALDPEDPMRDVLAKKLLKKEKKWAKKAAKKEKKKDKKGRKHAGSREEREQASSLRLCDSINALSLA
ncbi:RNA-binding motif protein, X-linked 2 [Quaeritorhiza haematococci]|nr:RNA-binding motif protein, X-linked 2 [Quaeritorhiza haematococci]